MVRLDVKYREKLIKYKHMEAKQHTSEKKKTDHRKNKKGNKNLHENENTTTPNLWDSVKAVLRGRFIAIQAYLNKWEKYQINNLTPTATRKRRNEEPQS